MRGAMVGTERVKVFNFNKKQCHGVKMVFISNARLIYSHGIEIFQNPIVILCY